MANRALFYRHVIMTRAIMAGLFLPVAGCSVLDSFASRVSGADSAYNQSIAENLLTNVLRAGYDEPTNFVVVGEYAGQISSSLTLGIPSLTVGPGRTVAQRQFLFGNNSTQNSANTTIKVSPLQTVDFANDFMTQLKASELGAFMGQNYPREILFYLFIDSLRVTFKGGQRQEIIKNDPSADVGQNCPPENSGPFDPKTSPYHQLIFQPGCEFHKFQYFLHNALRYNLSVEAITSKPTEKPPAAVGRAARTPAASPPVAANGAAGSTPDAQAATPAPKSRFCFDPGNMNPEVAAKIKEGKAEDRFCQAVQRADRKAEELEFSFDEGVIVVNVQLRTPLSLFRYLGRIVRAGKDGEVLLSENPDRLNTDHVLFRLDKGLALDCLASVSHDGEGYCLRTDAQNSKTVLAILARLIQLSTNRKDIPSSPLLLGL